MLRDPCRLPLRAVLLFCACLATFGVGAEEPDWTPYETLLVDHLSAGESRGIRLSWLNYSALAKDPRLPVLLEKLAQFDTRRLASRQERMAFYINAYNLFAIDLVRRHWPVASIREIGPWYRSVWKLPAGRLDGEAVSLDHIEHDLLRPMGDPRIHFAIVCASLSCPDLPAQAYRGARLDAQLDQQVHAFLQNPAKGVYLESGVIRVSRIFDWFSADFSSHGGVADFIRAYRPLPEGLPIRADLPYYWEVNGS